MPSSDGIVSREDSTLSRHSPSVMGHFFYIFLMNLGGVQLLGHPWPHADGMNPQGSVSFGMPTVSDVVKCDVPNQL